MTGDRATADGRRPPRRAVLAAPLAAVLGLGACGLGTQPAPVPVELPTGTEDPASGPPPSGWMQLPVYFVAGERLRAVDRRVGSASLQVALDQLAGGPSPAEAAEGVRTAILPQALAARSSPSDPPATATVVVGPELRSTSGTDQILAIAQVVYTVTELPDVVAVAVTTPEGQVVEVPTDTGLSREPVTRADYRSIAPTAGPSSASSPTAS